MTSRSLKQVRARRVLKLAPPAQGRNVSAFSDESGIRGVLTHGLAALAISALGLGVAGSIGLTSSAQAEQTSTTSSLSADTPDTTRAEPAVQAKDLARDTQSAIEEQQAGDPDSSADGDLSAFDRRSNSTSRNAVRTSLDNALAGEEVKDRAESLDQAGESVTTTSRNAVQGARADDLKDSEAAIEEENKRLEEEKRLAEEKLKKQQEAEERLKKQQEAEEKGTLSAKKAKSSAPSSSSPKSSAPSSSSKVDTSKVSGSGGAKPLNSYRVAARWGATGSWSRYHTGIDLSAPIGTPIYAAAAGVVGSPASGGGWAGTHVVLHHKGGASTLYAHMQSTSVRQGQVVKAGQLIGRVGLTGRTFGPHLHFEYYPPGARPGDVYSTKDPYAWMLGKGVKL